MLTVYVCLLRKNLELSTVRKKLNFINKAACFQPCTAQIFPVFRSRSMSHLTTLNYKYFASCFLHISASNFGSQDFSHFMSLYAGTRFSLTFYEYRAHM